MSINDNIGNKLDSDFENFNYLPQRLLLEDIDAGLFEFLENLDISVIDETGRLKKVPVIFLGNELWAEKKINWSNMRGEDGEEITRPFMALRRTGVAKGTSPGKYTIPRKKKFTYTRVPNFDGTLKGYDLYKIPQPTWVDATYELRFVCSYLEDVNVFYEKIYETAYSDGQGYVFYQKINGYNIPSKIDNGTEDNQVDNIQQERMFQIVFPITVHGKLVDPTKFEKVNTVTKISIRISEKKSDKKN
jgi:hypothetical protein